jgi:hypothetical protein
MSKYIGDKVEVEGGFIRLYQRKNGRTTWHYRIQRGTGDWTWRSLRTSHKDQAIRTARMLYEGQRAVQHGLEDPHAWADVPVQEALDAFLKHGQFSSDYWRGFLGRNIREVLKLAEAKTLADIRPKKIRIAIDKRLKVVKPETVNRSVITPMKQWSDWMANEEWTPSDRLSGLSRLSIPEKEEGEDSELFVPLPVGELHDVMDAARDLDILHDRVEPGLSLLIEVLLYSGNRTTAVRKRLVGELLQEIGYGNRPQCRIKLPLGTKRKRNGHASLPHDVGQRLAEAIADRSKTDHIFQSSRGTVWQAKRLGAAWDNALALAWVRREFPRVLSDLQQKNVPDADLNLAITLCKKRAPGQSGNPKLLKGSTIGLWQEMRKVLEKAASPLQGDWEAYRKQHTIYCLRHSHTSIASGAGVPDACIDKQTGHKTGRMVGRYRRNAPPTVIDPMKSVDAVYAALAKVREERKKGVGS